MTDIIASVPAVSQSRRNLASRPVTRAVSTAMPGAAA